MLDELHVLGLGVIEEAHLEFAPGLNVLTGETGAGKTMVALALSLALGARTGADVIRAGRREAAVEARFRLPSPASGERDGPDRAEDGPQEGLRAHEWADEGDLVLARAVRADGRNTARAGGRLATAATLAALGADLVEIHGQHQVERLLDQGAQRAFLDRFAGAAHLSAILRCRIAYGAFSRIRARLDEIALAAREREREKDLLAYQVREIEAAGVVVGEPEALAAEESRLAHVERIRDLLAGAGVALADDGGAVDLLREAGASLATVADLDGSAAPLRDRAAALVAEAEDLAAELRGYGEGLDLDPGRLEEVRERRRALADLERKYGEGAEGVLAYLDEARARLAGLAGAEDEGSRLEAEAASLGAELDGLVGQIGKARREAAGRLAGALTEALRPLGMPGAEVQVRVADAPLGPEGADRIEFLFSGGPGQPSRPLAKVASGGELSRTMLACRSVLADLDDVPTLVFDEVDAGIGGRAAAAVGARLAALARRRQIVVVTHLAQIAAHAERHFLVTKAGGSAEVRLLDDAERPAELARMLSGSVTDTSVAHARDLLGAAAAGPSGRGG